MINQEFIRKVFAQISLNVYNAEDNYFRDLPFTMQEQNPWPGVNILGDQGQQDYPSHRRASYSIGYVVTDALQFVPDDIDMYEGGSAVMGVFHWHRQRRIGSALFVVRGGSNRIKFSVFFDENLKPIKYIYEVDLDSYVFRTLDPSEEFYDILEEAPYQIENHLDGLYDRIVSPPHNVENGIRLEIQDGQYVNTVIDNPAGYWFLKIGTHFLKQQRF